MDFFHSRAKIIGRSKGRSAVAAASYRSGEKLFDERQGLLFDCRRSRRNDDIVSRILLPESAPEAYQNRETLWNAVEKAEDGSTRRATAQTAREFEIALPKELNRQEQLQLLYDYVQTNFVDHGMIADVAFHGGHRHNKREKDDCESAHDAEIKPDNPHAHIMLATRTVGPDGFGKKERKWNDRRNVSRWRQDLADRINKEMEKRGLPDRVDPRSYEEQGIDKTPKKEYMKPAAYKRWNRTEERKRKNRTQQSQKRQNGRDYGLPERKKAAPPRSIYDSEKYARRLGDIYRVNEKGKAPDKDRRAEPSPQSRPRYNGKAYVERIKQEAERERQEQERRDRLKEEREREDEKRKRERERER